MRTNWPMASSGALALLLAACGGGGVGGSSTTPTPISISSGATASVAENSTDTVYQVTIAGGSGTPTYTLTGTDAAAFNLSANGALTFKAAPDFEQPTDSDRNNTYLVTVAVADSSGSATRDVTVTVTNVADFTTVTRLNGSYTNAVVLASIPGSGRLFLGERNGAVNVIDPAANVQGTRYLDTGGNVEIRALAAAPDYATSGILYVSVFVNDTSNLEVRRYGRTTAGVGDAASADVIFRIPYLTGSLNSGGWIGIGADNLLYIGTGNGAEGGVNSTRSNYSLFGKVLRVDPTRDAYPDDPTRDYGIPSTNPFAPGSAGAAIGLFGEIYANGFRNPRTGNFNGNDVFVSDQYETSNSGFAYLYLIRPMDAGFEFSPRGIGGAQFVPILSASPNLSSSATLVAGLVYRGPSSDLAGRYVFRADGGAGSNNFSGLYTVAANSLVPGTTQTLRGCCTVFNGTNAVSFAEDSNRNLYFADTSAVYVIQYR